MGLTYGFRQFENILQREASEATSNYIPVVTRFVETKKKILPRRPGSSRKGLKPYYRLSGSNLARLQIVNSSTLVVSVGTL